MAKKPTQKQLLDRARSSVHRSKKWRQKGNYDPRWRSLIDLYHGKHWNTEGQTDQLVVNVVFSTINVMAPAVAIHNPRFVVNARNLESVDKAAMVAEILNYTWQRNDMQEEFRLAVLDFLLVGHGWCKIGYKKTLKKPVQHVVDVDGQEELGLEDRKTGAGNMESEQNVAPGEDRPVLERVSPFNMLVDPDARHLREASWVAQRTWRPVADVRVDERYSETQRAKVTGSHYSPWDSNEGDARGGESKDKPDSEGEMAYVEVVEFYDIKANTVGTFALGVDSGLGEGAPDDGWLIKPQSIDYATGHPFVMLRNYEVPDQMYPMGDVEQIESLQLELNETRTQMLNFRKKYRRGYAYEKGTVDEEGLAALESEDDNILVPVLEENDPGRVIAPLPVQGTPPEFFDQSAMIMGDMDLISGVSDYARGNPQQNIRRSATEAAMIQDASNARAQDRLVRVETALAECATRVVTLMQQYMTGEHVAKITSVPINAWLRYNKHYLQGEFDFDVVGGSTEPRNESFRRQSALQLSDMSVPFIDMGVANPVALYMKLLQDGFGVKDVQKFISAEALEAGGAPPPPEPPPEPPMGPGGPPMGPGGPPMPVMPPMPQGMPGPEEMGMIQPPPDPALGPPPTPIDPELIAALAAMSGDQPGQLPPEAIIPPPV